MQRSLRYPPPAALVSGIGINMVGLCAAHCIGLFWVCFEIRGINGPKREGLGGGALGACGVRGGAEAVGTA